MNTKNENKINKARSFCKEVKELSLKYELPFFVVTDGTNAIYFSVILPLKI